MHILYGDFLKLALRASFRFGTLLELSLARLDVFCEICVTVNVLRLEGPGLNPGPFFIKFTPEEYGILIRPMVLSNMYCN